MSTDQTDGPAAQVADDQTDQLRKVRYHLGLSEDALDHAASALFRAAPLTDPDWAQEFSSDLVILRDKIGTLQSLLPVA